MGYVPEFEDGQPAPDKYLLVRLPADVDPVSIGNLAVQAGAAEYGVVPSELSGAVGSLLVPTPETLSEDLATQQDWVTFAAPDGARPARGAATNTWNNLVRDWNGLARAKSYNSQLTGEASIQEALLRVRLFQPGSQRGEEYMDTGVLRDLLKLWLGDNADYSTADNNANIRGVGKARLSQLAEFVNARYALTGEDRTPTLAG